MTWLPDWSIPTIEVQIYIPDEDESTIPVDVTEEGEDQYRIMNIPYCGSGLLRWGDLIKAHNTGDDDLELIEVVEHAEHTHDDGSIISGKGLVGPLMDAIMAAGGFWANDMMSGINIFIPPGFDVDKWMLDNQEKLKADKYVSTHWDEGLHRIVEAQQRAREWSEKRRQERTKSQKTNGKRNPGPMDRQIYEMSKQICREGKFENAEMEAIFKGIVENGKDLYEDPDK